MGSTAAKVLLALAAIATAVVLFVVLGGDNGGPASSPGGETTTATDAPGGEQDDAIAQEIEEPKPEYTTIVVRGGEPVGGVQEVEVGKGEPVRLRVRSDVADEVHVHGYDVVKDVEAGGSVRFDFPAKIDGVFEVELEGTHTQIAELIVTP